MLAIQPTFAHADNDPIHQQFSLVDSNGDGYLTKDEVIAKASVRSGLAVSTYGGFELADVDRSGKLDRAEFAAFEEDLPAE
jgi:Ca2+-binding EF-hand superfamily protein